MLQKFSSLSAALALIVVSACSSAFMSNGMNTANLQTVDFGRISQMKSGESCATTILGIFTDGSAMISDAAKSGGLRRVELVEYKITANPLFSKQCAIVYGQ
jgi:hypothetical protein